MNKDDRAVLIACALGDGFINIRNRLKDGKYKYESSELRIVHNSRQKEYCEYKAERIRSILGGSFVVKDFVHQHPKRGMSFSMSGFSVSNKYWKQIRGWLYNNKTKVISREVLEKLNVEALAIWYMDDGHLRAHRDVDGQTTSGSISIATMCTKKECEEIVEWFLEQHDIKWNIHFDKRCSEGHQYFIQTSTKEARKFLQLIYPFHVPCMRYKFALIDDLISTSARPLVQEDEIV